MSKPQTNRRVFHIDVGGMTHEQALQFITTIQVRMAVTPVPASAE